MNRKQKYMTEKLNCWLRVETNDEVIMGCTRPGFENTGRMIQIKLYTLGRLTGV